MRIKLNGTILESNNDLVIEQWKKAGYTEIGNQGKLSSGEPQDGETKKPRKKAQE